MVENNVCVVAVQSSGNANFPYIFGDVFLRNFYITFDYNRTMVQLSASVNAPGVNVTILASPPAESNSLSVGAIVGISAGGLVVLIIIVVIVVASCKSKSSETQQTVY